MVKIDVDLYSVMSNPLLSVTSSIFAPGKVIVKRASYPKGTTPPHLEQYLIAPGTGEGTLGLGSRDGKLMTNTAINIAKTKSIGTKADRLRRQRDAARAKRAAKRAGRG